MPLKFPIPAFIEAQAQQRRNSTVLGNTLTNNSNSALPTLVNDTRRSMGISNSVKLCCSVLLLSQFCTAALVPHFQLHVHQTTTDHFGFEPLPTYNQRVYVNDTFWSRENGGPIFFYTGNEASITGFIKNTGILLEMAPQYRAMVVFAEARPKPPT